MSSLLPGVLLLSAEDLVAVVLLRIGGRIGAPEHQSFRQRPSRHVLRQGQSLARKYLI